MTITTAEIAERAQEIRLGGGVEGRRIYNEAFAAIEAEWKIWLYQDAAADLSTEASDLIFQKAWEEGHGSGYQDVDGQFRDLVNLVRSVIIQINKD